MFYNLCLSDGGLGLVIKILTSLELAGQNFGPVMQSS